MNALLYFENGVYEILLRRMEEQNFNNIFASQLGEAKIANIFEIKALTQLRERFCTRKQIVSMCKCLLSRIRKQI